MMTKGKQAILPLYVDEGTVLMWDDAESQYALRFIRDEYPDDPRVEYATTNVASLWCRHPRYMLGDYDRSVTACTWVENMLNKVPAHELAAAIYGDRDRACRTDAEIVDSLIMDIEDDAMEGRFPYRALDVLAECAVVMPLWLYDHSGLCLYAANATMSDAWDTGRVGYACALKQDVMRVCPDATEETWRYEGERLIYEELTAYNAFLNGEVWRTIVYSKPVASGRQPVESMDSWDEVDAYGPYYGSDLRTNGMIDDAPGLTAAIADGRYEAGRVAARRTIRYEFLRSA